MPESATFTDESGSVYVSAEPMPWGMFCVGRVFPKIKEHALAARKYRQFEAYSFKPMVDELA